MSDHLHHEAPLIELVARQHAGSDLAARVRQLRYKRRKRPAAEPPPTIDNEQASEHEHDETEA